MRQSIKQFEEAFREEAVEERERRARLRSESAHRARTRRVERVRKRGTLRFLGLVATILLTTLAVSVVMFETLAWLFSR